MASSCAKSRRPMVRRFDRATCAESRSSNIHCYQVRQIYRAFAQSVHADKRTDVRMYAPPSEIE
ncbi:hypothetical protein Plhal710r2_c030g0111251 [Plasmopara halstedii]